MVCEMYSFGGIYGGSNKHVHVRMKIKHLSKIRVMFSGAGNLMVDCRVG